MAYATPDGSDLVESLGAGSVFDVAFVRERGRTVVCKRLTSRARLEPAGRSCMAREARFLSLVRHPSLPSLVRIGSDGHGPFLLETRTEGISLRELGERWWVAKKREPPPSLIDHVARSALESLAEVHALADAEGPLAAVHGDIGPDHLLFGPGGELGFVDFGAARCRGTDPSWETDDRGTLPFAAPEIARGDTKPDAEADVYAIAATLVFLATGTPLTVARQDAAMLLEVGEKGLRPELAEAATAFSSKAREALREALAPERARRLTSARALLAAFES